MTRKQRQPKIKWGMIYLFVMLCAPLPPAIALIQPTACVESLKQQALWAFLEEWADSYRYLTSTNQRAPMETELVERLQPYLIALFHNWGTDYTDTQDLVQETIVWFLQTVRNLDASSNGQNLYKLLLRTAERIRQQNQSYVRRRRSLTSLHPSGNEGEAIAQPDIPAAVEAFHEDIAGLPEVERQVFGLAMDGFTGGGIAFILALSPQAVETTYWSAIEKLQASSGSSSAPTQTRQTISIDRFQHELLQLLGAGVRRADIPQVLRCSQSNVNQVLDKTYQALQTAIGAIPPSLDQILIIPHPLQDSTLVLCFLDQTHTARFVVETKLTQRVNRWGLAKSQPFKHAIRDRPPEIRQFLSGWFYRGETPEEIAQGNSRNPARIRVYIEKIQAILAETWHAIPATEFEWFLSTYADKMQPIIIRRYFEKGDSSATIYRSMRLAKSYVQKTLWRATKKMRKLSGVDDLRQDRIYVVQRRFEYIRHLVEFHKRTNAILVAQSLLSHSLQRHWHNPDEIAQMLKLFDGSYIPNNGHSPPLPGHRLNRILERLRLLWGLRVLERDSLVVIADKEHPHPDRPIILAEPIQPVFRTGPPREIPVKLSVLYAAIDKAPPADAQCTELSIIHGWSFRRISEYTGQSKTKVKQHISRGINILNTHLGRTDIERDSIDLEFDCNVRQPYYFRQNEPYVIPRPRFLAALAQVNPFYVNALRCKFLYKLGNDAGAKQAKLAISTYSEYITRGVKQLKTILGLPDEITAKNIVVPAEEETPSKRPTFLAKPAESLPGNEPPQKIAVKLSVLYAALDKAPPADAQCTELSIIHGWSITRISEYTGQGEPLVKDHIFRGVRKLAVHLGKADITRDSIDLERDCEVRQPYYFRQNEPWIIPRAQFLLALAQVHPPYVNSLRCKFLDKLGNDACIDQVGVARATYKDHITYGVRQLKTILGLPHYITARNIVVPD